MRKPLRVSASQDETFTRCQRQWWFSYPQRLPSIAKGDLDFGSVIHNVCERYLSADDTGRVPPVPYDEPHGDMWIGGALVNQFAGEPVDLYPKGWDTLEDKKGKRTISPVNSDLIKRLVKKAIDEGLLERRPDRQVEHWFERPLIPGAIMVGKIDMLLPGEVQDHKSTKAMKWAKTEKKDSPNYLGDNLQMLDYAQVALDNDPNLEVVRLRHNYFCKDPTQPIVRKVDVTVTKAQVAANWQRLMKVGWDMLVLESQKLPSDNWKDVPGPQEVGACEAFGGCPFVRICGGIDTPERYRTRVIKQIERKETLKETYTWDDVWGRLDSTSAENDTMSMNIFDKAKARRAAKQGSGNVATPPAPASKPIDGSVAAEGTVDQSVESHNPPWAQANCPACKGAGFNKKGSPCRICDATSKKLGGVTSIAFVIDTDGDGNIVWEAKDGSGSGFRPLDTVEPKVQERMELPAASPLDGTDVKTPEEPEVLSAIDKAADEAAAGALAETEAKLAKKVEKAQKAEKAAQARKDKKAEKAAEREAKAQQKVEEQAQQKAAPLGVGEDVEVTVKTKGRRKAGYFIYIDCVPIGVETIAIEAVFLEMAAEMASNMNVASYFDLDVYKRRESFARALTADVVAKRLNRMHIFARNPQGAPDLRAFIDAIIAVSPRGRVIQGVR